MTAHATQLEAWALEAGFDRAGVARLERSEYTAELERWLERGDHAGMKWLERRVEVRTDPRLSLPGALSVLCVALQYYPLESDPEAASEGDLWPGVARYARGEDYHDLMLGRLTRLEARIRDAFPGVETRRYVDTGPLLERELAQRAGLGSIGKNTNLLHREGGSWFLLGEVLLTLDVEPSPTTSRMEVSDLCGRCTRCLDACPTGALPEPFRLDARRCISYWTIEHRGTIPRELWSDMGDWVFGCDICQQVCPWNRRPEAVDEPALRLPESRRDLDLIGLLRIEREDYVERFRGSPLKRAKLDGLKRNASIAMANRGEPRYLPALLEELEQSLEERGEAAETLSAHLARVVGRIGATGGVEGRGGLRQAAIVGLRSVLEGSIPPRLRAEIEGALEELEGGDLDEATPKPGAGRNPS